VALLAVVLTLLLPVYPIWERRANDPGLRRLQQVRLNPSLRGLPWYSFNDMHIKQVWQAGRSVPLLFAALPSVPRYPLVVFSLAPEVVQLPPAWLNRTQIVQVDSFYTDRTRAGGHWRVWIVRAKGSRDKLSRW